MTIKRILSFSLLALLSAGCGRVLQEPYESCSEGDDCDHGTVCSATTLPASAGYTGSLCTNGCDVDDDCVQDLSNYDSICVNSQCYITCPTGNGSCPYGTACLSFTDEFGDEEDICTP